MRQQKAEDIIGDEEEAEVEVEDEGGVEAEDVEKEKEKEEEEIRVKDIMKEMTQITNQLLMIKQCSKNQWKMYVIYQNLDINQLKS